MKNPDISSLEFKDNIMLILDSFQPINLQFLHQLLKNPYVPFCIFISLILICVLNSILGIKPFYLVLVVFNIFISFIYYNPIVDLNKDLLFSLDSLPNINFLSLNTLSFGLIALYFKNDYPQTNLKNEENGKKQIFEQTRTKRMKKKYE